MKKILLFILSFAWVAYADTQRVVYPYFDVTVGGKSISTSYKVKSKYNYYFDREKDEMVYDKDLFYNVTSFDGLGVDIDFKGGVILRDILPFSFVPFLNVGVFYVNGTEEYKYYSLDKDEFQRKWTRAYISFLLGVMVYPFELNDSSLQGVFVSIAAGPSLMEYSSNGNQMSNIEQETVIVLELGNVWSVSEHYAVGFSGKIAWGFSFDGDNKDDVPVNSTAFGLALKFVRK